MKFNEVEYQISTHFLAALINGDETGLSDGESEQLRDFTEGVLREARETQCVSSSHWSVGEGEDFVVCDVTGMRATCAPVTFLYTDGEKE